MITPWMREHIKSYQDALEYIRQAYQARGRKRDTFTVALKDMYDMMKEKEALMNKENSYKKARYVYKRNNQ